MISLIGIDAPVSDSVSKVSSQVRLGQVKAVKKETADRSGMQSYRNTVLCTYLPNSANDPVEPAKGTKLLPPSHPRVDLQVLRVHTSRFLHTAWDNFTLLEEKYSTALRLLSARPHRWSDEVTRPRSLFLCGNLPLDLWACFLPRSFAGCGSPEAHEDTKQATEHRPQ